MTAPTRQRAPKGQGDRLRTEILDATCDLLIETGSADAVSIRAVADRVGVTAPSIYRHFPDKASLVFEVAWRECDKLGEAIAASADMAESDPVEFYRRGARAYVQFAVDHPEQYRIVMMTKSEIPLDREFMESTNSFGLLLGGIAMLRTTGRVRPTFDGYDDYALGQLVWSTLHGLASLLITFPDLSWPDLDELIAHHVDLVLDGLLTAPPTRRAGRGKRQPRSRNATRKSPSKR